MASIRRLQPNQIVWSIRRQKMGNTSLTCGALFQVYIYEVGEDYAIASWNGNPRQRYGLREIKKWRVNKPAPKRKIMGMDSYL